MVNKQSHLSTFEQSGSVGNLTDDTVADSFLQRQVGQTLLLASCLVSRFQSGAWICLALFPIDTIWRLFCQVLPELQFFSSFFFFFSFFFPLFYTPSLPAWNNTCQFPSSRLLIYIMAPYAPHLKKLVEVV